MAFRKGTPAARRNPRGRHALTGAADSGAYPRSCLKHLHGSPRLQQRPSGFCGNRRTDASRMGDRISALSQRSVSYLIAESAQRLLVLCRVHSAVRNLTMHKLLILIIAVSLTPFGRAQAVTPTPPPVEITTAMKIDVDGAPNAYGPKGKETLDYELNAHEGARATGAIVGYVTKKDGHTAETRDQV